MVPYGLLLYLCIYLYSCRILLQYCCLIQCIDNYYIGPSWFLFQTLAEIDKWGIDIFRIADLTNNRPLTAIAYTVFQVTTTTTASIITTVKATRSRLELDNTCSSAVVVAKLVCHAVNQMVLANDRYLFSSFSEPRAFENVHDSCKNVRCVHDDPRGSLRQRQSFPQQHTRGGRRPVH